MPLEYEAIAVARSAGSDLPRINSRLPVMVRLYLEEQASRSRCDLSIRMLLCCAVFHL